MARAAVQDPARRTRGNDLAARRRREFRDVRHPLRPDLRVERILVCPSGVHVVTAVPTVPPPDVLGSGRAAADVVTALLPQRYRDRVRPVLCRMESEPMAELVDGVLVTTPDTLEHIVRSSPVVLSTSEVNDVALRLDARLEPFPVAPADRGRRSGRRRAVLATLGLVTSAGTVVLLDALGAIALPW